MYHPPLQKMNFVLLGAICLALALAESGHSVSTFPHNSPNVQSLKESLVQLRRLADGGDYIDVLAAAGDVNRKLQKEARPDLEIQLGRLVGAAHLGLGHNREALKVMLPTREKATALHDNRSLYSLDGNLASVYIQMNNLEAASEFADEALAVSRAYGDQNPRPLMVRAYIYANLPAPDFAKAKPLYSEAITQAMETANFESAADAWQYLGQAYASAGEPRQAEIALTEAFRLSELHHLAGMDTILRDLSNLMAATNRIPAASVLMDEAIASATNPDNRTPLWSIFADRGRLRHIKGDENGALEDLRASLELVRHREVIPTDDDRVAFETGMADVYSEFIDTATAVYLRNHDQNLRGEIFEAAEENRARSLRALVPQPGGWRTHLTPEYAIALANLRAAERATLLRADVRETRQIQMLREQLHMLESRAGTDDSRSTDSAWQIANRALDSQTAILAFHLGPGKSWVWAMTQNSFQVHELPGRITLARDAQKFRDAVRANSSDCASLGAALGETLLGSVSPEVRNKHRWIVVLDQNLFELPFAALQLSGRYLAEDHALLVTPGIRMLEPAGTIPNYGGTMAGMGDAIYNRADPRRQVEHSWLGFSKPSFGATSRSAEPLLNLARLNGSGEEVRAAVKIWGKGTAETGLQVTKVNFDRALATNPAILHLATHVIKGRLYGSGVIVLGLNPRGEPDFVDMRDILLRPVKTQLVVMSGCASGDAQALPASGLMGLTRAWIGAGAGDVMATLWPTMDDSGPFFDSFYRNLREHPELGASEALRRAQVDMLHSDTFRGRPEYWASYFLVGKV